ncbi:MAG: matrixin family metalloprotease [Polyangiaceae bacterium]|nr:matrixin family metalloprotease [Polyangiaceae bacterium]MCW5792004.1 matrixin family metalloprotease [Polyangiaceae bacterium]
MPKPKPTLLALAAILTGVIIASDAHAYTYMTCNNKPVKWDSTFRMYRDRCSMPDTSDADWAYWNGGWQWWQITHRMDWNWWYNAGCTISHGNGDSQTALVDRANISGNNGLAIRFYDSSCTWSWSTKSIIETDVLLANDLSYSPENESLPSSQGRGTIIHEFGHALGLQHADNMFNMMRPSPPRPLAGGNTTLPHGDDANGARFLYGGSSTNLYVSAQRLHNGNIITTNSHVTAPVCHGQTVYLNYTIANNGSSNRTAGFRIYIRNTPSPGPGVNVFTDTVTVNAGNQFTGTAAISILPLFPHGTYWFFWEIDTANAISEFNESDNVVRGPLSIKIEC